MVFEDEDVADKVCALRNHTIDGKITEVRKAEPRSVLLNRKEKDAVNHFAFQSQADVARQQQTPSQSTTLDGECFCFVLENLTFAWLTSLSSMRLLMGV